MPGRTRLSHCFITFTTLACLPLLCASDVPAQSARFEWQPGVTREQVLKATARPFVSASSEVAGPSTAGTQVVDVSTLHGKVMCGYQGWFTCPGDGADREWHHWSKGGRFQPGSCTIDLWPDVSELADEERFMTEFRLANGTRAEVFSSMVERTVLRHFEWMREYGIDGVFVQRFGTEVRRVHGLYQFNTVLANCRSGANRHGRAWAIMYDLSGLGQAETAGIIDDWKMLVDRMRIGRDDNDAAYLHHLGKPVVAVWGIGFRDNRRYTVDECAKLIDFLAHDPKYGGNTVMVGVPTYWRTLQRDSVADPQLHEIVRAADIVSPWSVGRFGTPEDVERFAREVWGPDLEWCQHQGKEYLPVVFPGFSWHNMYPDSPLNKIPRLGGRFLWKQFVELRQLGATMVYQAMFDEVDEATAIFKCTNSPPVGASRFLDYEGLPSDHYLRLVGNGGRLIRGEIDSTDSLPAR